jgi:hypothetical protein
MADELGVEPGPEVRAAHLRVLQAERSLARVAAEVSAVPAQHGSPGTEVATSCIATTSNTKTWP